MHKSGGADEGGGGVLASPLHFLAKIALKIGTLDLLSTLVFCIVFCYIPLFFMYLIKSRRNKVWPPCHYVNQFQPNLTQNNFYDNLICSNEQ